jgi:glycine cleavage system H protein
MERHYLPTHEWVTIENQVARIGISNHAQETLGDIMFVELPKVGTKAKQGEEIMAIESMKAASPIHSPLNGTVTEINSSLVKSPEIVNSDPLDKGWLFTISDFSVEELESLMNETEYNNYL